MKNSLFIFVFLLITLSVRAQSPQKMSYQAVIRDAGNILVTNHAIGMRVSLLQGSASGTEVFKEIYNPNPQTNANGLVSIEIGSGLALTGNFATINWANGPYFIKTETDPVGGTNYSITGVSQLLSVPYALFAANGTPGAQGNTGNTGVAGLAGNTGASGASGIAGTMGLSGKTGATGSNGATGATGTIVSGTIGQTLRHDGTNWAANSFLLNSGSAIGIGTAAPSQALDVTGNIQSSGQFKSTLATGTAPFTLNSSTLNTNLNADLLDGQHYTSNWKLWSDSSAYITPNNASNFRIYDNTGYGSLLSVASTSTSSVTNFTNGTVNSKDAYNFLSTTYSYYGSGGNYGAFGNIKVKFLNNKIAFKGAKFDENVYIRLDTSYVNFKPPAIEKKVVRSYYFIPNGAKDSISSINIYPFKTLALDKGNIIFTDDNFESGETSLHIDNQFTNDSSYKTYTSGDTTYTFFVNQKINENPFPWNKEIHFGFKLDDKSGSRLGWIKFNILDISRIKIIETAIQKS